MSIRQVRRRLATAAAATPCALVVYHDGWGLEWFAPIDGAVRRLVYLHTERAHADELLRTFDCRVDGFLAVSRGFADRVRRVLPNFPGERICELPFFVEPPAWVKGLSERGPLSCPLRLGYAGRVERAHKRLDRLPALIAALDRRQVDFRFEVLGDGSYLPELQRQLARDSRVSFTGWRAGEEYWRTIVGWDVAVLLSDFEGFSRVTMECMCAGVLPVHPDFSPAATELLGPMAEQGLYRTGDVDMAAERIVGLAGLSGEAARTLRRAGIAHLAGHTGEKYDETYRGFLQRITALPARATASAPPSWMQKLPLAIYTRLFPRRF